MLATGNWVTPQINFTPHFTKPPLTYWLIASGLSLFGVNEWGARAFLALAFALTALLMGFLGKQWWGHRTGQMACLVYITMLLPFIAGNTVTTDTFLTFFETLAVVCFWMSRASRDRFLKSSLWAFAMWFVFGVAFLTKGPAGLLPLIAIIVYVQIQRKAKRLPAVVTIVGFILLVVTSLSWYWTVVRQNEGLLTYFIGHEFVGRVFTGEHRRNFGLLGPFKVYLPVLTLGALPWSCCWPALLRRSEPHILTFDWWKRLRERPKALFLLLWFGIPLVILCFSSSRLPLYVLPLFAPLALATAWGVSVYLPEKAYSAMCLRGSPGRAVAILLIFLVSSKAVAAHIPMKRDSRAVWNGIRESIRARVGEMPYEIVLVDENYDGLAFYSKENVEYTTIRTRNRTSPSFVPPENVAEEYDELNASRYYHIFFVREQHVSMVLTELRKRGVRYSVVGAPFGHSLIFCENSTSGSHIVRLAAMGDAGTGDSDQATLGSALYHVDQSISLDGILMLGDNIYDLKNAATIGHLYKERFENPYSPLLNNGVSFRAALGNHDIRHSLGSYQTRYLPFNMGGKRYYSHIFGDGVVEVFFLDSNSVRSDPEQVSWLDDTLAQSKAIWKVVALHHPLYSTAKKYPSDESMITLIEPLLIKHEIAIVLCGHNHVYERLRPIHGIHYFTVGSSGQASRGGLVPDSSMRAAGNDKENVALVLQFDAETCRFTAYGPNEEIVDQGKIMHALPTKTAAQLN
jgi:4-amino-4-deoxy-L-arabinose transferase